MGITPNLQEKPSHSFLEIKTVEERSDKMKQPMHIDWDLYTEEQKKIICKALREKIENISFMLNPALDEQQMTEIYQGLKNPKICHYVTMYATPKFDKEQMEEIRRGFEEDLTVAQVSSYADSRIPADAMFEMRCGIKKGLDVTEYSPFGLTGEHVFLLNIALLHNIDISNLTPQDYSAEELGYILALQYKAIKEGNLKNFNYDKAHEYVREKAMSL